jgi:hypothetical protein
MPGPIIVSSAEVGLPVAAGLWLAPKRGNGRFQSRFRPICARPHELMAVLPAEVRVS